MKNEHKLSFSGFIVHAHPSVRYNLKFYMNHLAIINRLHYNMWVTKQSHHMVHLAAFDWSRCPDQTVYVKDFLSMTHYDFTTVGGGQKLLVL